MEARRNTRKIAVQAVFQFFFSKEDVNKILKFAKSKSLKSILLTSQNYKGSLKIANLVIKVPSKRVDRIQEMHIAIGHMICEQIEKKIK